jgi:hypothetical protein
MTARPRIAKGTTPESNDLDKELHDTPASEIVAKKVQYVWPGRLPAANVCLFQGEKESGKSTWMRFIAGVISGGGKLPGDKRSRKPAGGVLWYAGEENLESRVRPGLEAAGANLDRCFLADLHGGDVDGQLALPNDSERLMKRVKYRKAGLVVIDPIFSFLDGSCPIESDGVEARRLIRELQAICNSTGCLILLSRNLTKDTSRGALAAGRGSGELANACRATLHCQSIGTTPGLYGLAVAGGNEGLKAATLSYRIVDAGGVQIIEPAGLLSLSADELVSGSEGALERSQLDQAKALIQSMIPVGKLDSKVIRAKAEAAMIHVRTLQIAAKSLGVRITRMGSRDKTITYWSPPKGGYPT